MGEYDSLMDLVQLVGIVSAVAAAAGAWAAFLAANATRTAAEESFLEQHQAATLAYVQANRERYRDLRRSVGEPNGSELPDLNSQRGQAFLSLIELWEHQAAGLNDGAFDVEVFNKMAGGYLLTLYREYSPWIRAIRRADPSIYDQLEMLVDKLIVMRASGYVLSRRSLKSLQQDGLTRAECRRMKSLIRNSEYTYNDLQRTLMEVGLDTEKNRVTRLTRMVLGHIKPMGSVHEEQVVDLFVRLERATDGVYPPRALLDHYYPAGSAGIEMWLAKGSGNHHFVFVLDEGNTVVGHVEVQQLNDSLTEEEQSYWVEAFAAHEAFREQCVGGQQVRLRNLAVIKRLGVHPDWQGRDIGRQLLRRSIHFVEHDLRKVPALVVLSDLQDAQALYNSEGATKVGEFTEATGESMVSYIF